MTSAAVAPILVAVDFSELTEAVVERAAVLARALGAELRLLHAAAPDPAFVGLDAGPQVVRDQRADELHHERARLAELAAGCQQQGIAVQWQLVAGPTVETILAHAAQPPATLIVIGSHGHGTLYTALLGSVSRGVLKGARCPVLVVPRAVLA